MTKKTFSFRKRKYLNFNDKRAKLSKIESNVNPSMDCVTFIGAIDWLIDNIYVTFSDTIIRQIIGVPIGTNCEPLQTNL